MRFRCIVSFRTTRSKSISTWRTSVQGKDIALATLKLMDTLKRRQRRPVTVIGMYLHAYASGGTSQAHAGALAPAKGALTSKANYRGRPEEGAVPASRRPY